MTKDFDIIQGNCLDVLKTLESESVQTCITSPPYFGLRNYGADGQIGLEDTPAAFVQALVGVFSEVRRVLKSDGTLFLNLGDSYFGSGKGLNGDGSLGKISSEKQRSNRGSLFSDVPQYGISGKASQGSQDCDSLSQNRDGERTGASTTRTSDSDSRLFQESFGGFCQKIQEYRAYDFDHFPIADFVHQILTQQFLGATLDCLRSALREYEPLLSSPGSTPLLSFEQLRAMRMPIANGEIDPLIGYSFFACVQGCVRMLGDYAETLESNPHTVTPFEPQVSRIQYIFECCYSVVSSLNVPYIQPYCTTSQLKPKDLIGIPWRVAFALQEAGWWLRQDIIWSKPNPMPESVTDRCTKAHEYIFLLTKSARYYYDGEAIREPLKDASVARLIQDISGQNGSDRVPGKTNGAMKAVRFGGTKYGDSDEGGRIYSGNEWTPRSARDRSLPRNRNGITGTLDKKAFVSTEADSGAINANRSGYFDKDTGEPLCSDTANKKSVWTVTTQPFTAWQETYHLERAESDEPSDDSLSIVSQDCPLHGDLFGLVASVLCGEREGVCSIHNGRIDDGHAQERLNDSFPTDLLRAYYFGKQNLDSLQAAHFQTANQHSSQNHKTDRVPATNQPCTPCAETLSCIDDTLKQRGWSEQDRGTVLSRPLPDVMDARLLEGMIYRNVGKFSEAIVSSCCCQLYHRTIKKTSHFATFPEKLIEPCVLAGSKEGDLILDPFNGAGTTGLVALKNKRRYVGIELNPEYIEISKRRLKEIQVKLF